jgi:hypothetical protein
MLVVWFANPNSFALLLNLATAVLLGYIVHENNRLCIAFATLLAGLMTYGVLHTVSASQLLVHYALLCYGAGLLFLARRWRAGLRLAPAAVMVFAVSVCTSDWLRISWLPVRDSLSLWTHEDRTDRSYSATQRWEMIGMAVAVPAKGIAEAAIGDLDNDDYHRLDGQFWVFLANGGVLTLFAFAVPALLVYLLSLRSALAGQADLALHLMIVAFGGALLASRVLQYFPFNFLFFSIVGLALRSAEAQTGFTPTTAVRRSS